MLAQWECKSIRNHVWRGHLTKCDEENTIRFILDACVVTSHHAHADSPVEWCGMYVISECSPEDLSSDRIHFLHQMRDFFVDHSVGHPVHVVEERGHCDGYRAAVDG